MIELTTGVAFLMSSLYGAGQVQPDQTAATTTTMSTYEQAMSSQAKYMDPKAVEAYMNAHYSNEPILIDIARCESTFRQYDQSGKIIRGKVNQKDVGVMQINETYHADEALKLGYDIYTVEGNAAFGKYLYDKYGAQPWSSSSKCWSGATGQIAQR